MSLQTITNHVSDVLTWVKRQFGDESGVQITDSDITRWLNQAQQEIAQTAKVLQAISSSTVTAGTYDYAAPLENAIEVVSLRVDNNPIQGWDFQQAENWIQANDPNRNSIGQPQFWWTFGGRLYMYPTPDKNYNLTLFYIKAPAVVTQSTDLLTVPDKYFEAIIQFVMSKAYELDEDYQAAQQARQTFYDRLGQQFDEESQQGTLYYPTLSFTED